jgi:hypothetical protein
MNYHAHTPDQLAREVDYYDQQLARTESADRRRRLRRKRELLSAALQGWAVRGCVPARDPVAESVSA